MYSMEQGLVDALGFAAATLTLVAFAQRTMLSMRIAALGANVFFIAYGLLGHYLPVLALHLVLLPLNVVRLGEQMRKLPASRGLDGKPSFLPPGRP